MERRESKMKPGVFVMSRGSSQLIESYLSSSKVSESDLCSRSWDEAINNGEVEPKVYAIPNTALGDILGFRVPRRTNMNTRGVGKKIARCHRIGAAARCKLDKRATRRRQT